MTTSRHTRSPREVGFFIEAALSPLSVSSVEWLDNSGVVEIYTTPDPLHTLRDIENWTKFAKPGGSGTFDVPAGTRKIAVEAASHDADDASAVTIVSDGRTNMEQARIYGVDQLDSPIVVPLAGGAREWGVGSYNQKAGPLTNVVDGRKGTLSFWFKISLATSGQPLAIGDINTGLQIKNFGADQMQVVIYTVTTDALTINFVADWTTAGAVWNHLMLSWDHVLPADAVANVTGYLNGVLQVNGVDGATVTQGSVDDDLKYNDEIAQGNSLPFGFNFRGCLSEFYLNFEDRLDLSIAGNREKFRSAGGDAVFIGGDGSSVTGNQPAFYASNGELNPNAGKSDNLPVVSGAVVDCADAPPKV